MVAMSFMPNQAAVAETAMNGTQMKPAFCSHRVVVTPLAVAACGSTKATGGNNDRHHELHDTDTKIAEAGIDSECIFSAFGKKKRYCHRSEIAATNR
jgi:hypothetical protein